MLKYTPKYTPFNLLLIIILLITITFTLFNPMIEGAAQAASGFIPIPNPPVVPNQPAGPTSGKLPLTPAVPISGKLPLTPAVQSTSELLTNLVVSYNVIAPQYDSLTLPQVALLQRAWRAFNTELNASSPGLMSIVTDTTQGQTQSRVAAEMFRYNLISTQYNSLTPSQKAVIKQAWRQITAELNASTPGSIAPITNNDAKLTDAANEYNRIASQYNSLTPPQKATVKQMWKNITAKFN